MKNWIELYNNNSTQVDLSGYYLTDTSSDIVKWQIPSGTIIPANGYLIIWADNEILDGPLHATFKLASLGESVVLSNPSLLLVDQINFSAQSIDMGFARVPNGTGSFVIQSPTYNANNTTLSTIDYENTNAEIVIYPNPASSFVNVSIPKLIPNQKIKIYNQLGQLVMENEALNQNNLDISNLSSGAYLLNYGQTTKKIVIFK